MPAAARKRYESSCTTRPSDRAARAVPTGCRDGRSTSPGAARGAADWARGGSGLDNLPFFPAECAPPSESSDASDRPFPKAAILGFAALLVRFVLMVAGNLSEYWFLNDLPHEGPDGRIRGAAWMTLLFGLLLVLTGASLCGIPSLRGAHASRLMGLLFTSLLPLTLLLGAVNQSWVGLPLGGLSVAASALGFAARTLVRPEGSWSITSGVGDAVTTAAGTCGACARTRAVGVVHPQPNRTAVIETEPRSIPSTRTDMGSSFRRIPATYSSGR